MRDRHNKQLPVSAPKPEHELHQRYLVHVGTASALAALATATATATATALATALAALAALTADGAASAAMGRMRESRQTN